MSDAAFYEAATAQLTSHRVIGFPLRPFSAGHLILLSKLSSPFLSGGPVDYSHVFAAAFICSQRFEDAITSMLDPELPAFERRWQQALCGETRWRRMLRLRSKRPGIDLERETEAFRDFMADGWNHPDWIADAGEGKEIGSPLVQLVKITLMSRLHLSESEFLNRPWSLSLWDYITLKEMDERLQIIDHEKFETRQIDADAFDEAVRRGEYRN
jgi:hypothetical protein